MSLKQQVATSPQLPSDEEREYYARLSNLTLLARTNRRTLGTFLESRLLIGDRIGVASPLAIREATPTRSVSERREASPLENRTEAVSYLILCLCFQRYCHQTNLAVRFFGAKEFEEICRAYNRLAIEHPDPQLPIFFGCEIEAILERVGGGIRAILCDR